MIDLARLRAVVTADTLQAETALGSFASKMGPGSPLMLGFAVAGAAVVGLGALSVKMASDFQESMDTLVTGAGEDQKNLKVVGDGIMKIARDTGATTKQLIDGMFLIESAGYHGADGLKVLTTAAEGAKVGNADMMTVADALTTILTDYHLKGTDAAMAMNGLIATVQQGKMHMEDFAGSLGTVLPIAASLHVAFPQVAAGIATMTNAGMDAGNAAQLLSHVMVAASAPNAMMSKALKNVGLSATELHDTLTKKGLYEAFQMVFDAIGKKYPAGSAAYDQATKQILGGIVGVKVASQLAGANMDAYKGRIDAISQAMAGNHDKVIGWDKVQGDLNIKFERAKQVVETFMIQLGTRLIPTITKLVGWLVDNLGPAMQRILDLFDWMAAHGEQTKYILLGLGVFIGGILVAAFIAWAISAGAAAVATIAATWPILAIIAVIALLVVGIKLLIDHWKDISAWLMNVWKLVVFAVMAELHLLGVAFQAVGHMFDVVWEGIKAGFKAGVNSIIGGINMFVDAIDRIQIHIPAVGVGPFHTPSFDWNGVNLPHLPYLAQGGRILAPGYALIGENGPEVMMMQPGAVVAPLDHGSMMPGRQTPAIHNHFYASMDDTLAKKVVREQEWAYRLHGSRY